MSGYGDYYKDMKHREFLARWAPKDGWPKDWNETAQYHYARAQKAEAELRDIRNALNVLKKV